MFPSSSFLSQPTFPRLMRLPCPEIDRPLGSEYAKESVAEKCARAVFMYSFGGGQQRGATLPQIRLAVLNPEMAPPFIADALDRMTKRLWYLYQDSGLY